jgi:hypothetical protein
VKRRAPRRTGAQKAVPLRPRLVEDDLEVGQAAHDAFDAHLLDLLERVCA